MKNKPIAEEEINKSNENTSSPLTDAERLEFEELKKKYKELQKEKIKQLNQLAGERGQTLAQMAIAWILRRPEVTTVLVGASRVSQLDNSLAALGCTGFSEDELKRIDEILA